VAERIEYTAGSDDASEGQRMVSAAGKRRRTVVLSLSNLAGSMMYGGSPNHGTFNYCANLA